MMIDIPENVTREQAERSVSSAEQRIAGLTSTYGNDAFLASTVRPGTRDDSDHSLHMTNARMFARSARELFQQGNYGAASYQASQATLRAIQAEGALKAARQAA